MTLGQLKQRINDILSEHPQAFDADVMVDTEARHFNVHVVDVKNIYFDPAMEEAIGHKIVPISIDERASFLCRGEEKQD